MPGKLILGDPYEGIDTDVAEALRNKKTVVGTFYDDDTGDVFQGKLLDYVIDSEKPYIDTTGKPWYRFEPTRVRKLIETAEEMMAWAQANPKRKVSFFPNEFMDSGHWDYNFGASAYSVLIGIGWDGDYITKPLSELHAV